MIFPVKHLSVSIQRRTAEVFEFINDPLNLPKWASGLAGSEFVKSGEEWITDSPMGKVKIKFVAENLLGVLDHDVTLPSGEVNHNPLRVVKNGEGSEVIFTLFRLPRMSDEDFAADAKLVEKDLLKLKSILEI